MRRIYTLLVTLFVTVAMQGSVFTVDGIKYESNPFEDRTKWGDGSENNVKVLGLEDPSYNGSLVIPESVTYDQKTYNVRYIEYAAFKDCTGLTSVTIPNTVVLIKHTAFNGCVNLATFNIPASVKYVYQQVFENTAWYNAQPDGLLYKDNVLLGRKGQSPKGALEIANGTRVIAAGAFQYCFDLTSVTIPKTLESICNAAFFQSGLTSVTIPASVKNIDSEVFNACRQLETIIVESGNTVYDSRNNCNAIIETAKNDLVYGCQNTIIPNTVTSISSFAFRAHWKLRSIIIPNSVKSIGSGAFYECSLKTITSQIEEPFTIYGKDKGEYNMTFEYSDYTTLIVPNGTKSKYQATEGWQDFNYIVEQDDIFTETSEEGVEMEFAITNHSSNECHILWAIEGAAGDLTIPEEAKGYEVKAIKAYAFSGCKGLTSVNTGKSVVTIGEDAFYNCQGLTNILIGESVTSIGGWAFSGCNNVKQLKLGKSVTSIGKYAFDGRKIEKVTSLIEEPFAVEENVFDYYDSETKERVFTSAVLYVPVGTKAKYEATEGWNKFKNIVEMVNLEPIDGETTVKTDELNGQDLSDNVVGDVYYNVGDNGYDATDGSIVISEATNMGQITNAEPGSEDVKENFTGIILKVAKGKGVITVNAKTSGNAQLVVQVGNGTPMIASKTEKGDVVVSYDVEEDTYVYIYAILGSSAARATRASTDGEVRIYGIIVSPGATGISSIVKEANADAPVYNLSGQRLSAPRKGINIVGGKKVVIK